MIRIATIVFLVASSTLAFAEDAPPAGEKITYEQHILPIFREKCGTCHNANDKKGDLVLDNYAATMRGGGSGEVIKVDGDADGSTLYKVVAHLEEPFMPPNQPKLPDAQIALIKKWIEGGALENAGSKARPKKNTMVTKVEVSSQRPAGPPPMPENLSLEPLVVAPRANAVTALATNPWSPLAAVSGHKQILLYETATLDLAGVLPFPEGQAHVLKFSRNGQLLLAAGGRGAHSGKAVVFDVKTGNRVAEIGSEYDVCLAADISSDHSMVALGGPKKIVRVYSVETGELMYEKNKHTDWITAIEFSPDSVLLATADRSNGLVVWEAFTGREFYFLSGHQAMITDVSWSPDSNLLATASEDTTIKLWEMQNGGLIKNWGAHGGGVTSVDFTRDSRLVSTGRDAVGKLWDLNGAQQKAFGGLGDIGTDAVYCAETDRVLIGDLTGTVHVFQGADAAAVGKFTTNPPSLQTRIDQLAPQVSQAEAAANQAAANLAAIQKGIADRKAAAEAATKAASDVQAALDAANKAKADADAAFANAMNDDNKKAVETAAANVKTATDALAAARASAEKAAAAAQVTPEIQKQLDDAAAASKGAADALAALKARLSKMQAAQSAPPPTAAK
jgi:hypothetical protein